MKRKIYLKMKSLREAEGLWLGRFSGKDLVGDREISVSEALGRVTSEPVYAGLSSPSFHAAAMDGVAVKAEETYGANERAPKRLRIGENAHWINTGRPLPPGTDAVIMVEKLHETEPGTVEIHAPAYPWRDVRKVGEDVVATELLFPRNHRIRPFDLGALLGTGVLDLRVKRRPRVAVIPTGNELISGESAGLAGAALEGRVVESNSTILAGMVTQHGGLPVVFPIVEDRFEALLDAVRRAVESDCHMVIVNAGSSSGSEDYTAHVLEKLGEILVHGVAMMPGKPTVLAEVAGKPVIGNPGYPVSAVMSFDCFAAPLLRIMQGLPEGRKPSAKVRLSRPVPSKLGIEEFLRVHLGRVGNRLVATPLPRGAGSITTLTRAEGIIRVPELSEGLSPGDEVEAELLVDERALERTLVMIGSHDMSIDVLSDLMKCDPGGYRLSSANAGSMGGLLALRDGTAHAAGSHLLDEATGEYNRSYVARVLGDRKAALFHLVKREQGLILPKGNPKGIQGLKDLVREDVTFINRQAGSGTRILLDFRLGQESIDSDGIRGYDREEYTHMAVAVDVKSGVSDVGLGIYAAARALDLDFIPVVEEQYDLVIPSAFVEDPRVRVMLKAAASSEFRERVKAMGGYDPGQSGELWMEMG